MPFEIPPLDVNELRSRHPYFFAERSTFIADCGVGWQTVVERCLDEIVSIFPEDRTDQMWIYGIKEKLGRLRIQTTIHNPNIRVVYPLQRSLVLAEFRSMFTCEVCGEPGDLRASDGGWLSTRCGDHRSPEHKTSRPRFEPGRMPRREMSDGTWEYDLADDRLVRR